MFESLPEDLWTVLSSQLTEERRHKMLQVAQQRSDRIRLILQDVNSPHNISACLRSAEAFGISNVHIVQSKGKFSVSSVAKGVDRWLTIHKHSDISSCVEHLKRDSFLLAAAMPNPTNCRTLAELPLAQPIAILFGNEHVGMSKDWHPFVDVFFTIPMVGMVESLNVSVSAAISLYELTQRSRQHWKDAYFFTKSQQNDLLNRWVAKQFPHWEDLYHRI